MKNSKTSLFLMELIIVILFFSISAAVCVQLFFSAHQTDNQTNELSHAEVALQNAAESYYACNGEFTGIAELYGDDAITSESLIDVYYNQDWAVVLPNQNCKYILSIEDHSTQEDTIGGGYMKEALITVYTFSDDSDDKSIILSQEVNHYIPYIVED